MSPKPEQTAQQPGADRFWGQFSQSKAGRTTSEPADDDAEHNASTGNSADHGSDHCLEWCPICRSADLFRATVSPELKQQAESIQHEAMGVLKAFLDAYTEKSAGGPGSRPASAAPEPDESEPPPPQVTDIPLE